MEQPAAMVLCQNDPCSYRHEDSLELIGTVEHPQLVAQTLDGSNPRICINLGLLFLVMGNIGK